MCTGNRNTIWVRSRTLCGSIYGNGPFYGRAMSRVEMPMQERGRITRSVRVLRVSLLAGTEDTNCTMVDMYVYTYVGEPSAASRRECPEFTIYQHAAECIEESGLPTQGFALNVS